MSYKNSRYTVVLPLIIAFCIVTGIVVGQFLERNSAESQFKRMINAFATQSNKLSYTLSLIESEYVDSISMDSIAEHALPLIVKQLDPHSVYIPASEMQAANESLDGEFEGIGVVFNMATDTVIVLNVIPKGPSDKAGVKAGDRIMLINDTLVAGVKLPQMQVVKRLRGVRGSKVKLSLARYGIKDYVAVDVVRDVIPIKSVEAAFMLNPEVGYIRLSQFARTSHSEVVAAINELRGEGMKRLIFDLRDNSGGFLDQAILIANEFLPKGSLIVYTEDRAHEQIKEYSDGKGKLVDMELVVLINEGSASSSEILAGALQDNDRGTIVGRRSFGKGLVQKQIPFADGSALRLTIARYYTPTGRSIQKPYKIGDEEGYDLDLTNRYDNNEFFSADSIHFADSLKRVTPKGKVVYGGGGIMPDLFIPVDTADVTRYFIEVAGRNILYRYTIEYADKHRAALDKVKTLADLQRLLANDKGLLEDFVAYAARHGVAPRRADIARSRKLLEAQLKAYIGRNTALEDVGFYFNIFAVDNVVERSLKLLNEKR